MTTRYDQIGHGYAKTRREDPRFLARIAEALGDARSVVNVGAGGGSYEPPDRDVIAVEPSAVMVAQRAPTRSAAVRALAQALPFADASIDAAMTVLSMHHWDEGQEQGVREMRRVARGPVVILTCDPEVSAAMWLMADYLTETAALDRQIFPSMERLSSWLGGRMRVETVPIPRDTPDWSLMSFWAHPERVLDAEARAAVSGFARMPAAIIERVVGAIASDLKSRAWDRKYGALRTLDTFDAGLRLVVSTPA